MPAPITTAVSAASSQEIAFSTLVTVSCSKMLAKTTRRNPPYEYLRMRDKPIPRLFRVSGILDSTEGWLIAFWLLRSYPRKYGGTRIFSDCDRVPNIESRLPLLSDLVRCWRD